MAVDAGALQRASLARALALWLSETPNDRSTKRIQDLFEAGLKHGEDGKLHGAEKSKAKEFHAHMAHEKCKVTQASVEEFFDDSLKLHAEGTFNFSLEKLIPLAEEGSVTARRLLRSRMCAEHGEKMMRNGKIKAAAVSFAAAYRLEGTTVQWEAGQVFNNAFSQFGELASDATEDPGIRADALLVVAMLHFMIQEVPKGLLKLRLAQHIQPEDGALWNIEGCILAMRLEKGKALAAYSKAKSLGSDAIEHTLFHRAILMTSEDEYKTTLEEFVARAPKDGRKICEAYYRLAIAYAQGRPRLFGAARRYYDLGFKAEESRLCVFAGDESNHRAAAKALVSKFQPCGNPECPVAGQKKCSRCKKISYCSSGCQKKDWLKHKGHCEK